MPHTHSRLLWVWAVFFQQFFYRRLLMFLSAFEIVEDVVQAGKDQVVVAAFPCDCRQGKVCKVAARLDWCLPLRWCTTLRIPLRLPPTEQICACTARLLPRKGFSVASAAAWSIRVVLDVDEIENEDRVGVIIVKSRLKIQKSGRLSCDSEVEVG